MDVWRNTLDPGVDVRWRLEVSNPEFHDIHHALRQLAKVDSNHERITAAADVMWNAHALATSSTGTERDAD